MKGVFFNNPAAFLVMVLLCYSCVSIPYLDKHQYHGSVKQLTEKVYDVSNKKKIPMEQSHFIFTKNGRVKYEQTFDADSNVIVTKEKKMWFVKQSFPEKEPYYCKTRWKTHNRERISCYTQKRYKQNQSIYYYHDDGSIAKIEEDFSTFNTQYYHYNIQNELIAISIKDKDGTLIDSVSVDCKTKDRFNNCITIEKHYMISDSLIRIDRILNY